MKREGPSLPVTEIIAIHGMGSEMQGVGRLSDGRAAFVPGALPGETVEIRVRRSRDRFVEAQLLRVVTPSPERVAPACPLYGRCGGCQTQHMAYEAALRFKRDRVYDALTRIGGVEAPDVRPTVAAEPVLHTRNKAEYACGVDSRSGTRILGVHSANSHDVLSMDDCLLQHPLSLKALNAVRQLPILSSLAGAVTRVTRDGQLMLTLTAPTNALPNEANVVSALRQQLPELVSLYFCRLKPHSNHALDGQCRLLWGQPTVTDELCGLSFELSPQSFFQVNPLQAEKLYDAAIEAAQIQPDDLVLDAYCGAGTITLCAARRSARTVGVEIVAPAIENANRNAKANGLSDRVKFVLGDAAEEIPRMVARGLRPDVVITDPPRKGMDRPLIDALLQALPRRIVYVSCNPATLARDVKLLGERYRLAYAVPVDMFPLSAHVECVVLMSRVEEKQA
ncbi:MAG: 23S rRNA (uracil(1939)-C(5))-methyltransferase RlmD [Clostridia bacterium]|nr:23S rRNA (uracil(1939)-C(5))-methyltransferase RlmD [Clostridia bacterium]